MVGQAGGQAGTNDCTDDDQGSGGGGTFVYKQLDTDLSSTANTRVLIAGGGGGASKGANGGDGLAGIGTGTEGANGDRGGSNNKGYGGNGYKNGGSSLYNGVGGGTCETETCRNICEGGFGGGGVGDADGGGGGGGNIGGVGGVPSSASGGGSSYRDGLTTPTWAAGKNDGHGFVVVSKSPYSVKTSGTCTNVITTVSECTAAAYALIGSATTSPTIQTTALTSETDSSYPTGCYHRSTGNVYLNSDSTSVQCGANGDNDKNCICAD
eukprot:g10763.t1